MAGREPVIARDVGGRLSRAWLPRSRFADVAALARSTLTLGPDAAALYHLGRAQSATGQPREALTYYRQALTIWREVGDRAGEAVTRYNIAMIHRADGNIDKAISELERVVDLDRQVSDPDLAFDTAVLEEVRQEQTQARTET